MFKPFCYMSNIHAILTGSHNMCSFLSVPAAMPFILGFLNPLFWTFSKDICCCNSLSTYIFHQVISYGLV